MLVVGLSLVLAPVALSCSSDSGSADSVDVPAYDASPSDAPTDSYQTFDDCFEIEGDAATCEGYDDTPSDQYSSTSECITDGTYDENTCAYFLGDPQDEFVDFADCYDSLGDTAYCEGIYDTPDSEFSDYSECVDNTDNEDLCSEYFDPDYSSSYDDQTYQDDPELQDQNYDENYDENCYATGDC